MAKKDLIVALSILAMLANSPIAVRSTLAQTPEDFAVYSALIEQKFVKDNIKLIVIQDQTQTYQSSHQSEDEHTKYIIEQLSPVSRLTLQDFFATNREPVKLTGQFNLKTPFIVLTKEEMDNVFIARPDVENSQYKAWQDFHKKYPDSPGFILLSRVGYDPEMKQAMVYLAHVCGGLCAEGRYVLPTKEEGNWKIKNELHLWIS